MTRNWKINKLGQVCDIGAGNSAPQKKELFNGGKHPFFRTSDVGRIRFGVIGDSVDKLNEMGIRKLRLYRKGTLLFPKSGASTFLNHRVLMATDGYVASHLATLKAKDNILDDRFLFYFSSTIDARSLMQDQNYPSLRLSDIQDIEILLPSFDEQKRIVKILDDTFEKTAKAKENAEKNLQSAKELFEIYLQHVLTDKRWEKKTIGDVCEKVEYGSAKKSKKIGKVAVLRMGNIQDGRLNWDDLVYSDDTEDNKQYLLKYNDVLFNRTNSPELVGKTAIYKGEMPAIFAGYLIRIHRKEGLLDADFLNYYLNSKIAKDYGKTVVISSVNQANINGTKLKSYPIPCPSLKEQQIIVKKLNALLIETKKLEAIYQQKLADLEELKKSILHKAFNGELLEAHA